MPKTRRNKKYKQKSQKAGSKQYRHGDITNLKEKHNGHDFFRKYGASTVEHEIAKILENNPHPNIVKIYNVTDEYIDIEEVTALSDDMDESNREAIISAAKSAKKHLQNLNIMYIDWKPDNMGMSDDGKYKLFDFDTSGITKSNKTSWKIEPNHYWSYNQAIDAGRKTPIGIDNFAFNLSFKD
jgi:serine/threonine protein kinase